LRWFVHVFYALSNATFLRAGVKPACGAKSYWPCGFAFFFGLFLFILHLHSPSFSFIGTAPEGGFLTGSNGIAGWMGMGHKGPKGHIRQGQASFGGSLANGGGAVRSYAHC
jgi:hypothetical protein